MSKPPATRERNKRLVVPAAITALSVGAVGVLSSGALFTSSKTVGDNTFTAGTVDINAAPASTVFKAANMAPGDVVVAPITVKNDGSLDLRYAMTSTATGDLAPALRLQVKAGVSVCTATGFEASGTNLYGVGAVGDTTGTYKVLGDSKTGPDVGDRTLASGASEDLCLAVSLPGAATGNEYQAKTAEVTFRFNAEQTKNNDILPPTSTDSTAQANGNLVTWDPSPSPVAGYQIRRSADGGKTWTTLTTVDDKTFSYLDTTALGGETYSYTVLAVSSGGTTAGNTKPPAPVVSVLLPATDVKAAATSTDDAATITWAGSKSQGVTGYTVQRSIDGGSTWGTVGTADATTESFTDKTTTAGTAYIYRVVTNGPSKTATSEPSGQVIAGTLPPSNVAAAEQDNGNLISWVASPSPNTTGYQVLRTSDGQTWQKVGSVDASTRSYLDSSADGGETYAYTVVSIAPGGTASAQAAPTGEVASTLLAPSNVTVVATATDDGITVGWTTSTSHGVAGYTVQRSEDNGSTWKTVATTNETASTYTDTATTAGTSYVYRVVANGKTKTAASTASSPVIAGTLPPATMNVVAQDPGNVITWTASPSNNTTGYKVLRSGDAGATWDTLIMVGATTRAYTDTTSLGGETYSYAVVSVAPGGTSSVRSQASAVTTVLLAPTGVTVAATSTDDGVSVGWTGSVSNGVTGYTVQRSADNGSTWTNVGSVGASGGTYTDKSTAAGIVYVYRVVANGKSKTAASAASAAVVAGVLAPSNVAAVADDTTNTITWASSASTGVTGYRVLRSADGGSTWATLTTTDANTSSYTDNTALGGETYSYTVVALAPGGTPSAQPKAVSVQTTLLPPTKVQAVATSTDDGVTVSWAASASKGLTGYMVQRSEDNGSTWSNVTSTAATASSYTDATTAGTSYVYRVVANGKSKTAPSAATGTVVAGVLPPASVTGAAQNAGNVITWTASPSANKTGYKVLRSADGGSTWSTLTTTGASNLTYTDTTALGGESYSYTVVAVAPGGTPSVQQDAVFLTTAMLAPTGVKAVSTSTDDDVTVSWTASASNGVTGYTVQRSGDNGSTWASLTTTIATATSYTDKTATAGGSYVYRVVANGKSKTAPSAATSTVVAGVLPPTALAGAAQNAGNTVTWTASASTGVTGYRVLRSADGGSTWTTLTTTGASATSYTDTTSLGGETYSYTVVAVAGTTASTQPTAVSVQTVMLAPTGVTAAATSTDDGATVSWTASASNGVTGYTVQRSADNGSTWVAVTTTAATAISYTDKTTAVGTSYVYRVVANGKSKTAASAATSAVVAGVLPPASVSGVAQNAGNVITWTASPSANKTGYKVLRSADGGSTWTTLTTTGASTLTYTDTTAVGGTTYSYTVVAVAPGGTPSAQPSAVSVQTVLLAPTGVTATVGTDSINVAWTASTSNGVTGYTVQRSADNGSTWSNVGTTSGTTYTDSTVVGGASYTYRVVANAPSKTAPSTASAAVVASRSIVTPAGTASDTSAWTPYNSTSSQWTMNNGQASTSASASSNPILATDSKNQNVSTTLAPISAGSAIYSRVTDGSNWLRARVNQTQTSQTCTGCGSEPTGYFSKQVAVTTQVPHSSQVFDHYSVATQTRSAYTVYSGQKWKVHTCNPAGCANPYYNDDPKNYPKTCGHANTAAELKASTLTSWGPQKTIPAESITDEGCARWEVSTTSTGTQYTAWTAGATSNSATCPADTATVNYTCTAVYKTVTTYTNETTYQTQTCTEWYYSDSTCENGGYTLDSQGSPYRAYDTTTTVYTYYLVTDKAVAGQVTQLASYSLGASLPAYIRLVTNGNSIKTYYGSNTSSMTLASTVTDSFNQTATRNGVGLAASSYGTPSGVGTVTFANAS